MTVRKNARPPARAALVKTVTAALEDMKAVNVKVFDVRQVTDVSDCMVLASGNSDRHVRSIADRVVERAREAGFRPMGVEGARDGEWVLVDLNDVIVHVMLPRVREFYGLEELWDAPPVPKARARAGKGKAVARTAGKAGPRTGRRSKAGARTKASAKVSAKAGSRAGAPRPARGKGPTAPRGKKSAKGSSRPRS